MLEYKNSLTMNLVAADVSPHQRALVRAYVGCYGSRTQSAIEVRGVLSESPWKPLNSMTGDGTVKVLTDSSATPSQRFYRVRVEWWPFPGDQV